MAKIKTAWDLKQLYSSEKDPNIEKDIQAIEFACMSFAKKHRDDLSFLEKNESLLVSLVAYEKLIDTIGGEKPLVYFWYRQELNSADKVAAAQISLLSNRLTKARNAVLFFELALGQFEKKRQDELLKDKAFEPYWHFLWVVFSQSKHNLSESEEKILGLKSLPSHALWVTGFNKVLTKQMVKWKGQELTIDAARSLLRRSSQKDRTKLHALTQEKLESVSDFAESELNAVVTDKKIEDELRGYEKPYSATVMRYQNDERVVETLVDTVTKSFSIAHDFYKIKASLLGMKKLTLADYASDVGKTNIKIPFAQGYNLLHATLASVNPIYADILKTMAENGQIDVYPRKGKAGGAFCSHTMNTPTVVLLNHADDLRSFTTFSHEMGHAIHSERSRLQPTLYKDYVIPAAETASTFFEALAMDRLIATLPDTARITALHDKIQEDVATIFRQVAFFNFENELHTRIRAEGSLSHEALAKLLAKHLRAYLGSGVTVTDDDGYLFVLVSHFRNPFYVYSYAYGQLISKVLLHKYRQDPAFIQKIDQFLTAGGSKRPDDIFRDIGIDPSNPVLIKDGLAEIENDIKQLKALVAKKKRKK